MRRNHHLYKMSLLLTFTLLLMSACSKQSPKYTIGVSQCSEDIWRDKLIEELRTSSYIYDGVSLKFATAHDNDQLQQRQIDSLAAENVDLLIISPNQINTVSPAIKRAQRKGIPIVLFDRKSTQTGYTAFMGADNYKIGKVMGEYICKRLHGKGNVVEIMGLQNSSPAIDRHRGLVDALRLYPDIRLVASSHGDWTMQSGEKAMKEILKTSGDIDCVFGQNDRMAMGARKVMERERPDNKTLFVGIDALATKDGGIMAVKKGYLDASYMYPTRGDELLKLSMNILQGKPYKKENLLDAAIVTRDNADVMLMQADELQKQNAQLEQLHQHVDRFLLQYNGQKLALILVITVLSLLLVLLLVLYRGVVVRRRMAEQTANAKLRFFTNVSHELRTPLTLISAPVEQLYTDPDTNDKQRALLTVVKRNTDILMRLVNEILDFRKVQSGKMQLRLAYFDLSPALRQWTETFIPTADSKKITIHVDVPDHLLMMSDAYKLERICYNLISNAVKYTPEGGEIWVRAEAKEKNFEIRVEDTDIGIPKDKLTTVFERFFQVDSPYSKGTGVGLALVKAFTEMLHGTVNASNREPNGIRFTLVFPMEQPHEGEVKTLSLAGNENSTTDTAVAQQGVADKLTSAQDEQPKQHILVVDDNADIRSFLASWLGKYYDVSCASNGQEGFEIARREVPDLVLSDVMMPVLDGLGLCRKLKSDMATSHIPVLLLTARTLDDNRASAYDCGADGYIGKPFSEKVLLARVRNLIDNRQRLRNFFAKGGTTPNEADSQDNNFADKLRRLLQEHLSDSNFGVEQIGEQMGLSRVQLYRKVKALTGHSPVEILREARLRRADHLLGTTDKTVSEIAYEVGFSSPSYFAKCYKEMFGKTPKEG